ncbi:MAG: radical SAM protein [bacterium]|nr:radical SAM protein [bacterium]
MKFTTMAKAGLAVLKGNAAGVSYPLFVTLATNNSCQSHCKYCKIPKRQQRELTTDEIFRLIDEIAAMGTLRLGIWGGEPLLRADIIDIVKHARAAGLYVTLDSNGYLLPQKREILDHLDHLIISLDGPKEAHDANREEGSWEKVMAAINCVPPGMTLWTITVLTKNNIDKVDWILDEAGKRKFIPTFQVLHHSESFGINDELRPSPEEYRKCLSYLREQKKKGRNIGTSIGCFDHLINWKDYKNNMSPEGSECWKKCWGGKFFVNVDANGDLYPCSLVIGSTPAPNFLEHGFAEAYKRITPPPCQSCLATCFSEYNLLLSLNAKTIMQWVLAMGK